MVSQLAGSFRVQVAFPQELAGAGFKRAHPTVPLGHDDLIAASDSHGQRAGPMAVQDVLSRRAVLPNQRTVIFAETQEARCIRCGRLACVVGAVSGTHVEPILVAYYRTAEKVSRATPAASVDTPFLAHVDLPD